jgi:hypothetical protein
MIIAGVVSTGGLTALFAKFQVWKHSRSFVKDMNPKEDAWAK